MYKLVRRVIQYFSFPNRPIKGGDIFGFLERGGILEKGGGGYDPSYQLWYMYKPTYRKLYKIWKHKLYSLKRIVNVLLVLVVTQHISTHYHKSCGKISMAKFELRFLRICRALKQYSFTIFWICILFLDKSIEKNYFWLCCKSFKFSFNIYYQYTRIYKLWKYRLYFEIQV